MSMNELLKNKANLWVDEMYLPYLGKCTVTNNLDETTNEFKAISINPLRKNRKDENEVRYVIFGDADYTESIPISFCLETKTVSGYYFKRWIGGQVERFDFNFSIDENNILIRPDDITETFHTTLTFKCITPDVLELYDDGRSGGYSVEALIKEKTGFKAYQLCDERGYGKYGKKDFPYLVFEVADDFYIMTDRERFNCEQWVTLKKLTPEQANKIWYGF